MIVGKSVNSYVNRSQRYCHMCEKIHQLVQNSISIHKLSKFGFNIHELISVSQTLRKMNCCYSIIGNWLISTLTGVNKSNQYTNTLPVRKHTLTNKKIQI